MLFISGFGLAGLLPFFWLESCS